jgi:hypothetical protein
MRLERKKKVSSGGEIPGHESFDAGPVEGARALEVVALGHPYAVVHRL